jgi:vacuolar protein sorting-associated protein 45
MTTINLIELVRFYIDGMIKDCGQTIKGFIMDKETVCDTKTNPEVLILVCLLKASIVSMAYTPPDMLQKEVFIFERIDNSGKGLLKHLAAICFLRPTQENFKALVQELHEPRYGNYFLCMFILFNLIKN